MCKFSSAKLKYLLQYRKWIVLKGGKWFTVSGESKKDVYKTIWNDQIDNFTENVENILFSIRWALSISALNASFYVVSISLNECITCYVVF